MDELPDLRSDQDVDILLSRLRARIAPPPSRPTASAAPATALAPTPGSSAAWTDFVAVQHEATTTMVRALSVLADAMDELAAETRPAAQDPGIASRVRKKRAEPLRSSRSRRRR